MDTPKPQSVRDLQLMYDTCGYVRGGIEFANLKYSSEANEGDILSMCLRVVPDIYTNKVVVRVESEQATNLRGSCYTPKYIVNWEKTYSFKEFVESPFYEMTIERWSNREGFARPLYWDTHAMDDHEVYDDDTRWGIYAHVYEHEFDFLGNWRKTGHIEAVDIALDEDGELAIGLTYRGKRHELFYGSVWEFADLVELAKQLDTLKDRGIEYDGETLTINLSDIGGKSK